MTNPVSETLALYVYLVGSIRTFYDLLIFLFQNRQFVLLFCARFLASRYLVEYGKTRTLNLRERHRGPLAVAAESPGGAGKLVRELPLLGELPLIDLPAHSTDSDYPAIAWQPRAARIAVHRATTAAAWLRVGATIRYAVSIWVALYYVIKRSVHCCPVTECMLLYLPRRYITTRRSLSM